MFETSKDILFIVLAFASLWVAVFLCWALYYCGRILKNANEVAEEVRERAYRLDETVRSIREHLDTMSGLFSIVAQGITKVVGRAIERRFIEKDEEDEPKKKK